MTNTASSSINLSEKMHQFQHGFMWRGVFFGGVVPRRWAGFLLSDCDERNGIIGAARDGPLTFR